MHIKRTLFFFLITLLLCACSNEFEKSMNSGKEALKNGDYEKAAENFDYALIEKPNDKDALSLKERSEKEYKDAQSKKELDAFLKDVHPLYEELTSFNIDLNANPLWINKPTAEEGLKKAQSIKEKLNSLPTKWENTDFKEPFSHLIAASDELISAYSSVIDPPDLDITENSSERSAALKKYNHNTGNYITEDFEEYYEWIYLYEDYVNKRQKSLK